MEPKDYARRLIRGSGILFLGLVAASLFALGTRMLLARVLPKEDFGLFYGMLAVVSMFTFFKGFGVSPALTKFIPEFRAKKEYGKIKSSIYFAILMDIAISLIVGFFLFLFSEKIASLVLAEDVSPQTLSVATTLLRILSIWFIIGGIYVMFGSIFQGFQEMVFACVDMFLNPLIFFMALVFILGFSEGVKGVAYAYLGAAALMGLIWAILFRKRHPEILRAKVSITSSLLKQLYNFSFSVLLGGLAFIILGYMDTLAITKFKTTTDVATYNVALSISRLLSYIPGAVGGALLPLISEIWTQGEQGLAESILRFITKFSFLLILPAVLVFFAFPEIIIRFMFGSQFLDGILTLRILTLSTCFMAIFTIFGSALTGVGKPAINTLVISIIGAVNLIGNFLAVPIYGMEGAAAVTAFSWIFGSLLIFYMSKKYFKSVFPSFALFKIVIGGVLTLIFLYLLKSFLPFSLWFKLFAVIIPSLMFYGAVVLMLRVISEQDLELIREILPMPEMFFRVAKRIASRGFT